jgi:hypothetical protein
MILEEFGMKLEDIGSMMNDDQILIYVLKLLECDSKLPMEWDYSCV